MPLSRSLHRMGLCVKFVSNAALSALLPEWGRLASQFGDAPIWIGLLMRHREDINVNGSCWASPGKAHSVPSDSLGPSALGGGHVAIS